MTTCALTIDRLKEVLHYEPSTGVFTWLKITRGKAAVGDVAGCTNRDGYIVISVDGRQYKAHRLAWFYAHGTWPAGAIDHRDHVKANNAITNLRDATDAVNNQNMVRPQRRNSSGFLGVYRARRKWRAKLMANGRVVDLGLHETPELAHQAYVAGKRQHHEGNTL